MADQVKKFIFPKARASFPFVLAPNNKAAVGDDGAPKEPRYELTTLFKKTPGVSNWGADPGLKVFRDAYSEAVSEMYGPDKTKWPKLHPAVLDGDEYPNTDGCAGCWMIRMSATVRFPPIVLKRNKSVADPVKDEGLIYGGCYVDGKAHVWFNKNPKTKGFRFGMDVVRFVEDGERFGGSVSREEAVEGMPDLPDDLDSLDSAPANKDEDYF
jgi:hypothetical protein